MLTDLKPIFCVTWHAKKCLNEAATLNELLEHDGYCSQVPGGVMHVGPSVQHTEVKKSEYWFVFYVF